MAMKQFKLVEKKALTSDVFELHFECSESFNIVSWQFVTFLLPVIGWRAYSILEQDWNKTVLIIKRVTEENGWRGGSIMICDTEIWEELKWVGPVGHFVLKPEDNSRLFIWTGTWLVPLYNQIKTSLERGDSSQINLVFWVRTTPDLFYAEELKALGDKYPNFSYELYLSREESETTTKWYITDFLTTENVAKFSEFYICWAPAMVDSSIEKLEIAWADSSSVFSEKF